MSKIGDLASGVVGAAKTLVGGPIWTVADKAIDIIKGSDIPEEDKARHIEEMKRLALEGQKVTEATHVAEVNASVRAYEADAQSKSRYQAWARPSALYILYVVLLGEAIGLRSMLFSEVLEANQFRLAVEDSSNVMRWAITTLAGIGGYYVHRRTEEKMARRD